ncbi:MAG: hypothetical protein HRT58_15540 [Crocinitomicaceae bacterium]|nr:hypothetical protein [Flavobacteriales bacterium]NQZ37082.1 hypothetical protein [Crocinitomicaceae bacterium]
MSDTIGTFWIISKQDEEFKLGDSSGRQQSRTIPFPLTEQPFNSWAYITLMAKGVSFGKNKLYLNDTFIGFLDPTPSGFWIQQTYIVEVYSSQIYGISPNNKLRIEAYDTNGNQVGNIDDFEIKHIVFNHRTNR